MRAFRYGFLCHHENERLHDESLLAGWSRLGLERFVVWLHPEASIMLRKRAEGTLAVIGDAYCQSESDLNHKLGSIPWDDPWPDLNDIGGRYAILFLSQDDIRVANDAFGSRCLFYSPDLKSIGSHSLLLATCFGKAKSGAAEAFMERPEFKARTAGYLPGDLTAFEEVFSLVPNNYWDGAVLRRYWPREPNSPVTLDEFSFEVRRYFDAFVPFIHSKYTPVFGVTGGIDSRAVFAAFGRDFVGTTWTHYFPAEERPVVEEIIRHLGIEHRYVTAKDYSLGEIADAANLSKGLVRKAHALVEGMAANFPGPDHVFIRGYGGEILRGFSAYRRRLPDLSPESMTNAYNSSVRGAEPTADYLAFCHATFESYRQRANYEGVERYGYLPMDHFYWEHRMGTWAASTLDEMDTAMRALVGFNSRPLFASSFGLDNKVRLRKSLLQQVVAVYDKALAAIPIA